MKRNLVTFFLFLVLFFVSLSALCAQTTTDDPNMISTQFDTTGFPQWAKDLRRGEIITFGVFPFAYFFSNFVYDTYRWSNNGWDTRYAPWPIASAGSFGQTKDEKIMTLGIAAGTAIFVALVDYGIMRYKRNKLERENQNLPEGTQIITRRPLLEEQAVEAEAEVELLNEE